MRTRRFVASLLLATLTLAACEQGDVQLVKDFIVQWATDHAGEIAAHRGGPLLSMFAEKDPNQDYVDAAVDGYDVVSNLQQADELMARGRKNSDAAAMDAALRRRPRDWTYELSRADLALQQGDVDKYQTYQGFAQQDARGVPPLSVDKQQYSELVAAHNRLDRGPGNVTGYSSYDQCYALYSDLLILSDRLTGGTMNVSENQMTAEQRNWLQRRDACDKMPH